VVDETGYDLGEPNQMDRKRAEQWFKASPSDRALARKSGTAVLYTDSAIRVLLHDAASLSKAVTEGLASRQAAPLDEDESEFEPVAPPEKIREVLKAVSVATGVPVDVLKGPSRVRQAADARAAFALLSRAVLSGPPSWPQIGRAICRDHTTVLSAHDRALGSPGLLKLATHVIKNSMRDASLTKYVETEKKRRGIT